MLINLAILYTVEKNPGNAADQSSLHGQVGAMRGTRVQYVLFHLYT